MNVVIFGKGFGKPRQLNLSGPSASVVAIVCAGVVSAMGFAGGYWYSSQTGSGLSKSEVAQVSDELQLQRENIEVIRQSNEDTLDALAIRVAQMNARIIRLDALGRRLTHMADIEDGEFDFDSEPALGGPEEPVATGSNVAIPELVDSMQSLGDQLNSREAQLGALEGVLMGQNLKDRVYPQGRPVSSGWISSYFGKRTDPFTGKRLLRLVMASSPGLQIATATASWLKSTTATAISHAMLTMQKILLPSVTRSGRDKRWRSWARQGAPQGRICTSKC